MSEGHTPASVIAAMLAEAARRRISVTPIVKYKCEDGSVVVEWLEDGRRATVFFELDPSESSWHFAARGVFAPHYGSLDTLDVPALIALVVGVAQVPT